MCRFLAEDRFLPSGFATRGRRLVYTDGIVVLAVISGFLLIVFGGITDKLIPLFAVGAFGAFLFSQLGMVKHWLRNRGPRYRAKLFWNALGASSTAIVLVVIGVSPGELVGAVFGGMVSVEIRALDEHRSTSD